jgi:glycosyltransferase involved in cell wall biosynthesis
MNRNQSILIEKIIFSLNGRDKLNSKKLIRELKGSESLEFRQLNILFNGLFKLIFEPNLNNLNIFLEQQIKYGSEIYFFSNSLKSINELSYLANIDKNDRLSIFNKLLKIYELHLKNNPIVIKLIINNEILKKQINVANSYFENLILKILNNIQAAGNYNLLLEIESNLYDNYIRHHENEDHFHDVYKKLNPILRKCGSEFKFSYETKKIKVLKKSQLPIVVFFIHNASMLAHIISLLDFFRGLKKLQIQEFVPFVICLTNYNSSLWEELNKLGIDSFFFDLEFQQMSILERIIYIREFIKYNNIKIFISVSLVVFISFMFSMRIAPIQVWWSMKYHNYKIPEIDFYMTGGALGENFKIRNKTKWLVSQGAFSNLVNFSLAANAIMHKKSLGGKKIILGSFGREEKLRSNDFLNCIVKILTNNPNVIFLWTGKIHDVYINEFFLSHGVIQQTNFIGWVDTKFYAHVIDIYLDSFPFPSGLTIYEAMALGVPTVLFKTNNSDLGIQANINGLYYGLTGELIDQKRVQEIFKKYSDEELILLANNKNEYIDYANKLIKDINFRKRVGNAGKCFINEYMSDISRMASGYALHISNMLKKKVI